ncbi:hypothetical protein REPUB_Repub13aG0119600 [Reevesia pubescens]
MAVVGSVGNCVGNVCFQRHESSNLFKFQNPNAFSCSLMVSNPQSLKPRSSTTKILPSSSKVSLQPLPKQEEKKKKNELLYDKIDEWMRDSVVEIVKKLPESPLLVQVYSDNNTTKTRTEKAEENNWVSVKQKWEKGESPMPDGLIFVEQIQEEEEGKHIETEKNEEVSRAWGIVVQGKAGEEEGCGPAPACYLLKTSKVNSGFGLRCTHFCLVIFFTDPVDEYLMQYLMDYDGKKFQNVSKEGLKIDASKQAYMRGKRTLEINPSQPIIKELHEKVVKDPEVRLYGKKVMKPNGELGRRNTKSRSSLFLLYSVG